MKIITIGLFFLFSSFGAFAQGFTYSDLVTLIQTNSVDSIEKLLPLLPASFRSSYTLMHSSRSLQQASAAAPRVIMFGSDASLICTFNGDSQQRGSDGIECIQYLPQSRSFDFRHIQFPTPTNQLQKVTFSKPGFTADGKVACASCHTQDLRPNWNEYRDWKDSYDGRHVAIPQEYFDFVKKRDRHPRYKWLIQDNYEEAPFAYSKGPDWTFYGRPNMRFAALLTRLNAQRVARIMEAHLPLWIRLMPALSSSQCEFSDSQQQKMREHGKSVFSRISITDEYTYVYDLLLAKGVTPRDFTTSIDNNVSYQFSAGYSYLSEATESAILVSAAKSNGKIASLLVPENEAKNIYPFTDLCSNTSSIPDFIRNYHCQLLKEFNRWTTSYDLKNSCEVLTEVFVQDYIESK